jgi:hypothetical protein
MRPSPLFFSLWQAEPGRRSVAKLLTKDEARRIAANVAKLPELLSKTAAKAGTVGSFDLEPRSNPGLLISRTRTPPKSSPIAHIDIPAAAATDVRGKRAGRAHQDDPKLIAQI